MYASLLFYTLHAIIKIDTHPCHNGIFYIFGETNFMEVPKIYEIHEIYSCRKKLPTL